MRKITLQSGIITTVVGTGNRTYGGDNGSPTSANICMPVGLVFSSSDDYYISDHCNNRIRKVTASSNIITTVVGTGSNVYNGDNMPATSATVGYPQAIAIDDSDNLFIADFDGNRIRKVTMSTGIITTVAGDGNLGYSGDNGPATAASIANPIGVDLDSSGNIYFTDYLFYSVVRKVTVSTGIITTIAGTGSTTGGYNGDSIQATAATLKNPYFVIVDSYDNIYISDLGNCRVRKVTISTGVITTFAGNGEASSNGDGAAATAASICPTGFSHFDSNGNLYISENNRIRKVVTVSTEIPSAVPSTVSPSYIPSYEPSAAISTVIPTTPPSLPPSGHPTAYPSHTIPSEIYFMTHQVLQGLSATDYNFNRSLSDTILLTAITQSINLGIKMTAITISSIGDQADSSRSLIHSAASKTLEVQYTIQYSSQRWADDIHGIAAIIKALNDSVARESFDAFLRNSAWESNPFLNATTISIAFFTAAPTSMPTSAPTQLDVIAANIFNTGLSEEILKGKTDYYLGSFTGYFVVIFILLWLLELTSYGQQIVRRLHDSAHSTAVFDICGNNQVGSHLDQGSNSNDPFTVLFRLNKDLNRTVNRQEMREKSTRIKGTIVEDRAFSFAARLVHGKRSYPDVMYKYIRQRRTLLGCQSILFPNGFNRQVGCFHFHAPKSKLEDLLLYICNHHTVLSCLYSAEGERLGHMGRRIVYITKDCISFFMSQMAFTILRYLGVAGFNYLGIILMILMLPSISRLSQGTKSLIK